MATQNSKAKVKAINEMPHNLEAEQSLLGCILIDQEIQVDILPTLTESDFYAESHKIILSAMKEINLSNVPVDLVTLIDKLEKQGNIAAAGGIEYLTDLTGVVPSTANYLQYLDIVKRDGTARNLIQGSTEIIKSAQGDIDSQDLLAFAEKTIFDISTKTERGSLTKIDTIIPDVMNKFDEINKDKNAFHGVSTGFKELDFMTNGLQKGDYILIAARPSYGKTSFAMNIVENAAIMHGKTCAVFSLEMGKEQLAQRMLCSVAGVGMEDALKSRLDTEKWKKIAIASKKLSNANIFIDDTSNISPSEILSKCRRFKRRTGLDLIMIDYIGLMSTGNDKKNENRTNEVAAISRSIKMIAKELDVPVIVLSQLSRLVENRPGNRPQLSDLRESGAIEQDADIVMFIHRPDKARNEKGQLNESAEKNVAEILVEKFRNGATGMFKLLFKKEITKFVNYEKSDVPYNVEKQAERDFEKENASKVLNDDGSFRPIDDAEFSASDIPPEEENELVPDDGFWGGNE